MNMLARTVRGERAFTFLGATTQWISFAGSPHRAYAASVFDASLFSYLDDCVILGEEMVAPSHRWLPHNAAFTGNSGEYHVIVNAYFPDLNHSGITPHSSHTRYSPGLGSWSQCV